MTSSLYDPVHVAALFDRCADRYRLWSVLLSFGFIPIWRRRCVARLLGQRHVARIRDGGVGPEPSPAPRVIDLMAGSGELWPPLLKALPRARITAIDISPRMHALAQRRLQGTRAELITHLHGDALTTDLPDGSADAVISAFGLKTLDAAQQTQLAAQIARLLRPGGSFALIEVSDPKGWALRPLFRFYLDRILPLIERLLLRGAQDFTMIGIYSQLFADSSTLAAALRAQGLHVTFRLHTFGCASSVAGHKPIARRAHSA